MNQERTMGRMPVSGGGGVCIGEGVGRSVSRHLLIFPCPNQRTTRGWMHAPCVGKRARVRTAVGRKKSRVVGHPVNGPYALVRPGEPDDPAWVDVCACVLWMYVYMDEWGGWRWKKEGVGLDRPPPSPPDACHTHIYTHTYLYMLLKDRPTDIHDGVAEPARSTQAHVDHLIATACMRDTQPSSYPPMMECVADTFHPYLQARPCQSPPTMSVHIIPYAYTRGLSCFCYGWADG